MYYSHTTVVLQLHYVNFILMPTICYNKSVCLYLFTEWRALEHFNSLCDTLPYNHHFTINKLKTVPQIMMDDGEQFSKLITPSSTDVRKINEKIITYLIIKLCYNGSDTSLVSLCDVMDELIDHTGSLTCVQQIRYGMYMLNIHSVLLLPMYVCS